LAVEEFEGVDKCFVQRVWLRGVAREEVLGDVEDVVVFAREVADEVVVGRWLVDKPGHFGAGVVVVANESEHPKVFLATGELDLTELHELETKNETKNIAEPGKLDGEHGLH